MNPLDVDVDLTEADRVPLRKAPNNVGIVDVIIISSKSVGRNLVDLSGHSYLVLIPCREIEILKEKDSCIHGEKEDLYIEDKEGIWIQPNNPILITQLNIAHGIFSYSVKLSGVGIKLEKIEFPKRDLLRE